MSALTTSLRTSVAGPVLALDGVLDHDSAPQLHHVLQDLELREGQQLTVEMTGIAFCDSSGISALLAARRRALQDGAQFAMSAVPDRLLRTFGIVGLDQVLTTFATTDQAIDAWAQARPA